MKTRGAAFDQVYPGARPVAPQGPSTAAFANRAGPIQMPIPVTVRRAFLVLVVSMPFEQIVLPVWPGSLSPAKISGYLFFLVCLWYPKASFPRPSPAVLWFSGYLATFLVLGLFISPELRDQLPVRFRTMAQLVVLFWVGSRLLQDTRLVRQTFFAFGAATSGLAAATLLNVPGFAGKMIAGGGVKGMRTTALGYGPNDLAMVIAVAAVMLMGLLLDNTKRSRGRTWLLRLLLLPLLLLLVGTSSRGGLASFVLGMSLFLVPMAPSRRRLAAFALGVFALVALGAMIARDPVSLTRWTQTAEGRVAGRDAIYARAIQMVQERPILGWGPGEFLYELGSRLGTELRDPHNMFLWLLLEVGIVGALFFLAGFGLCVRAAWKSRNGPEGILPLALMVTITAVNLSGSWLARKPMWVVCAIALASPVMSTNWQRSVALRNRLVTGAP